MAVRQLEFFVAVAEERNFTRAAVKSFVSQPGLSSSIRALERELRVRLFDRGPSGASLTSSGAIFLPRARRMLDESRWLHRELTDPPVPGPQDVGVGAEQCLGDLVDLIDLITAFGAKNANANLTFEQAASTLLEDRVAANTLDVALVARGLVAAHDAQPDQGTRVLLRREPFVLITAPDHPLVGTGSVSLPTLGAERFVDLALDWAARQVLDAGFARQGLTRTSAVTVGDVHMVLDLVRRNFGVAAVPESIAAKSEARGLAVLPIVDPSLEWESNMLVAEHAGPAARAFAAMLLPHSEILSSRLELTDGGQTPIPEAS